MNTNKTTTALVKQPGLHRALPGFLHPWSCMAWLCIPLILHSYLIPSSEYQRLWMVEKYLHTREMMVLIFAVLCYGIGVFASRNYRPQPMSLNELHRLPMVAKRLTWIGFAMVILANIIWLAVAAKNGLSISVLEDGFDQNSKTDVAYIKTEIFTTIPGVTTATQFAMATAMLSFYVYFQTKQRRYLAIIAILFSTALMRAVLRAERLAVIEMGVPLTALATWLYFRYSPKISPRVNTLIRLAPLWLPILAILIFGVFEYFRSWKYYQHEQSSFVMFILNRFVGYYATSFNNGALCISDFRKYHIPLPYHTLHGLWANPISPGYEYVTGIDLDDHWHDFLGLYASPEFNTPSGLAYYFIDYGIIGGCIGWIFTGYWIGVIYRQFVAGRIFGLIMYPLIWLSLLYMPMASMLMAGRLVPSYLFAIAAWWMVHRSGSQAEPIVAQVAPAVAPTS